MRPPSKAPPSGKQRRSFPRITCTQDGAVQVPRSANLDKPEAIACTISSLSPDGIGFALQRLPDGGFDMSMLVTVAFHVDKELVHIPAAVAWSREVPDGLAIGARLRLELAGSEPRRRYTDWISRELGMGSRPASRVLAQPAGHSAIRVDRAALRLAASMATRDERKPQ